MEVKLKPKVFRYPTVVRWDQAKKGSLTVEGKPALEVASPPEFGGHPGIWSPEDLLVAAVNACTMMTFLSQAAKADVRLVSYESEATGTLEMVDRVFRFSKIALRPRIVLEREEDLEKAREAFFRAESGCLVANSLITTVEGVPEISAAAAHAAGHAGVIG